MTSTSTKLISSYNNLLYSYKCGFARTQEAYDFSVNQLAEALDRLEEILSHSRFVCGAAAGKSRLTEVRYTFFSFYF